jgi:type IV secretory pathway VirB3-like protein
MTFYRKPLPFTYQRTWVVTVVAPGMIGIHILLMNVVVENFAGKLLVFFFHVQFYYISWHDF